jgi:hypothetical protein
MPWNKDRKVGQKRALRRQDVRTIRERLRAEDRKRDLALFSLAIDSKLPACDLVAIRVKDVYNKNRVRDRASVVLAAIGQAGAIRDHPRNQRGHHRLA